MYFSDRAALFPTGSRGEFPDFSIAQVYQPQFARLPPRPPGLFLCIGYVFAHFWEQEAGLKGIDCCMFIVIKRRRIVWRKNPAGSTDATDPRFPFDGPNVDEAQISGNGRFLPFRSRLLSWTPWRERIVCRPVDRFPRHIVSKTYRPGGPAAESLQAVYLR